MSIYRYYHPHTASSQSKWAVAEWSVLIIGVVAVGTVAVGQLLFEPSMREREETARLAMASEHSQVCDQLGKSAGASDRDICLNLLDDLNVTHKQAFMANSSDI